MGFWIKGEPIQKKYMPVYPVASTLTGFIGTTDVGKLCVANSTATGWGGYSPQGGLPAATTADQYRVIGIIAVVPEATTPGSTVPFYVQRITPYDYVEAQYSTTVERSTGASIIATSNIGYWIGLGGAGTTTVVLGKYMDPSLASTAPGTTNGMFFKMLGFSTQNDTVWGCVNSSHIAN